MQEETRVGREIKEINSAALGRGRRKLAERERKSRMGRSRGTGVKIYPQFHMIPRLCREGSKAKCNVSANLMGLRYNRHAGCVGRLLSTLPQTRRDQSLKGRYRVMVAAWDMSPASKKTSLFEPMGSLIGRSWQRKLFQPDRPSPIWRCSEKG